jgi:hypothetical protein
MPARYTCPKCDGRAYRVYAETTSPATRRSTKVTLPALWCGTLGTQTVGGRVVGTFAKGPKQHGLVSVEAHAFALRRRQSIAATTRAFPQWKKAPAAKPAKAGRKAPSKPARKAPRAVPERVSTPKRVRTPAKPRKARQATLPTPTPPAPTTPAPEPELTDAGKALLAKGSEVLG